MSLNGSYTQLKLAIPTNFLNAKNKEHKGKTIGENRHVVDTTM